MQTAVVSIYALLLPPRYLHLDLPKHVMRNVSWFRLRAHILAVESCSFPLSRLVCVLSQKKVLFPFLPFLPTLFYGGPLFLTCLAY